MDLETYRASNGLTFKALADRIGVRSEGYVWDLCNGNKSPGEPLALRIFHETGLKLGRLANLTDEQIAVLESIQP